MVDHLPSIYQLILTTVLVLLTVLLMKHTNFLSFQLMILLWRPIQLDLKMSSHQVTQHMDTSRSQDRSVTPRMKRRGRDGTRESREPLGTLGFKLKLSVDRCYKQYCYTLILLYISTLVQLSMLPHSFVSVTVLQMKPMKFPSSLSRAQDRKMTPRKMRESTIPMNRYLLIHPGNKK